MQYQQLKKIEGLILIRGYIFYQPFLSYGLNVGVAPRAYPGIWGNDRAIFGFSELTTKQLPQ